MFVSRPENTHKGSKACLSSDLNQLYWSEEGERNIYKNWVYLRYYSIIVSQTTSFNFACPGQDVSLTKYFD